MGLFDFNDEKNNGIDLLFLVGQMVYPKSSLWQLFDFTAKSTESMWHITSSMMGSHDAAHPKTGTLESRVHYELVLILKPHVKQ